MVPAKLLLFGEHTILQGGEALALPLRRFGASWSQTQDVENAALFRDWAAFAKTRPAVVDAVDLDRWGAEVDTLAVESTIPQSYGLGSSGALTALVYRRYSIDPSAKVGISTLRTILSELECFFHGRSSGLDPLVSTLDSAIHVDSAGAAWCVKAVLPQLSTQGGWFLLDSHRPKVGGNAIKGFGESCKNPSFREAYLMPALAITQQLIAQTVGYSAQTKTFDAIASLRFLHALSQLQLEHLHWLIPDDVAVVWRQWDEQEVAYLKLCGAGGGGYFLGYAIDRTQFQQGNLVWL